MTFQSNLVNNFWHVCQFLATCLFQDLIFCPVGSLKWCGFNSSDILSLKWLKETAKMPHIHAERNSRVWNNGPNLEKKHLFCLILESSIRNCHYTVFRSKWQILTLCNSEFVYANDFWFFATHSKIAAVFSIKMLGFAMVSCAVWKMSKLEPQWAKNMIESFEAPNITWVEKASFERANETKN